MTSMPLTKSIRKDTFLDEVPYIYYPIQFKKNEVQALINSGSKVNAMISTYALKLSFRVCRTNVGA